GVLWGAGGAAKGVGGKVETGVTAVLAMPEVQRQIVNLGMIPSSVSSPEELERFIGAEIARWGKVVAQAGLAGTEERHRLGALAAKRRLPHALRAFVGNLIQPKTRRPLSPEFQKPLPPQILQT